MQQPVDVCRAWDALGLDDWQTGLNAFIWLVKNKRQTGIFRHHVTTTWLAFRALFPDRPDVVTRPKWLPDFYAPVTICL